VIGMAGSTLLAVACAYLARLLSAVYWALAMLAVAELLRLVALNSDFSGGTGGISSISGFFEDWSNQAQEIAWLGLSLVALTICVVISILVSRSQVGRIMRMVREHEDLAASLGHDVGGIKIRVMAISAPMAALSGSLYTLYLTFIGPQELEPFWTFLMFTMLVVGGSGSIGGALVGTYLIQLTYDLTRFLGDVFAATPSTVGGVRILIIGALLLGFLLLRPDGIVPERIRRIHVPG